MATKRVYKVPLVILILALFSESTLIEALQCYTCSDCEEVDDGSELKTCNELPTNTSSGSSLVSTEDDSDEDYDDEYNERIVELPDNIKSRRTKAKRPTLNETDSAEFDTVDGDLDSDGDSDRSKSKYQLLDNRAVDDVCYSALLYVNGTSIIERGCSSQGRRTCQSLFSFQQLSYCQICTMNGCNKVSVDQSEWQASMNNGESLREKIWCFAFLPLVLMYLL